MRSFLRNGDLFLYDFTWLLALFPFAIIFLFPASRSDCPLALLNYLVIFQLLGLYSALITNPWPSFSDEKGSKKAGVEQNDSAGHGDDNGVIEGGIGLVFISDKVLLSSLLA